MNELPKCFIDTQNSYKNLLSSLVNEEEELVRIISRHKNTLEKTGEV